MTKEELKQEAEVCMHNALFWLKLPISKENVEQGGSYILKLLEPREKRIAELEDKLANADYQLEGRDLEIKELKAQIEKMKCCGNCAKNGHICVAEEMQGKLCGKNKDKWELRR
jgi:hypothetical protein